MHKYPSILNVFKRDPETNHKTLIWGDWSMPEFGYLADNQWVCTEKIDGTNVRVIFDPTTPDEVVFKGRTDEAQLPKSALDHLTELFQPRLDSMTYHFSKPVCLYGEGFGGKIQRVGPKYGPTSFRLFDINIDGVWLKQETVEELGMLLNIPVAPIIQKSSLWVAIQRVQRGFMSELTAPGTPLTAEGLVCKPAVELNSRVNRRIITKIKHVDFRF